MEQVKISFIGGGNMAGALIAGLVKKEKNNPRNQYAIHVVDIDEVRLNELKTQLGVSISTQINATCMACDVMILAVKPQQMSVVLNELKPFIKEQLIISIASGIRLVDISRVLSGTTRLVRAMPNLPAVMNVGITGMYAMKAVSEVQQKLAHAILSAVGETVWVDNEALLDPLTAISGCGPAYVFYFIEQLQKAGEVMGLNHDAVRQLAVATFLGAAELVKSSPHISVSALREQVTSKGGSTHAAIQYMEDKEVGKCIIEAVKKASERSSELGQLFGSTL